MLQLLANFEVTAADLLGSGGEASVYALNTTQVVRIYHGAVQLEYLERRRAFYALLAARRPAFEVPQVFAFGMHRGHAYTIEQRMHGQPFDQVLPLLDGAERQRALHSYLDVAEQIGQLHFPACPFGEVLTVGEPLQRPTWSQFLWERMQQTLATSLPGLQHDLPHIDHVLTFLQAELALFADVSTKSLVHGDYFPGNVFIAPDHTICGVSDWGYSTVVGDGRLDLVGAVIFLEVVTGYRPEDTPLLLRQLLDRYGAAIQPVLAWYRLYYSIYFSHCKASDPATYHWCLQNLQAYINQA